MLLEPAWEPRGAATTGPLLTRARIAASIAATVGFVGQLGCGGSDATRSGADAGRDTAPRDGVAAERTTPPDAADAGDAGPDPYHDIATASFWSTSATGPAGEGGTDFASYAGGTFDGRYVYYAPLGGEYSPPLAARYDTKGAFGYPSSAWSTYDLSGLDSTVAYATFQGAVYDGRYVYLVPDDLVFQTVVRYDTRSAFTDASAWAPFNLAPVSKKAIGFAGGTFDGRYVYLVPSRVPADDGTSGLVVRYDSTASFDAVSSWTTFETTTLVAGANGFTGAVFDGRYVYLVPNLTAAGTPGSVVARYDTKGPFASASSWETQETTTLFGPRAAGFSGGAFDGRFIYLVPGAFLLSAGVVVDTLAVRYDTQAAFAASGSWSSFDMTMASPSAKGGFSGSAFDGRYIYYVPTALVNPATTYLRFDTTASFGEAGSWSTFDVTTATQLATSEAPAMGGIFDGSYIYFSSLSSTFRFDAREPPALPRLPAFHGSFF